MDCFSGFSTWISHPAKKVHPCWTVESYIFQTIIFVVSMLVFLRGMYLKKAMPQRNQKNKYKQVFRRKNHKNHPHPNENTQPKSLHLDISFMPLLQELLGFRVLHQCLRGWACHAYQGIRRRGSDLGYGEHGDNPEGFPMQVKVYLYPKCSMYP